MADAIRLEGLNSVREMLAAIGPGLEKANEKAQNRMAYALMVAEREQVKSSLDRPTDFTVSSIAYKKVGASSFSVGNVMVSTPNIPGAGVFVVDRRKQAQANDQSYLGVQIFGGSTAGPRGSEVALRSMGFMPSGKVWVPAAGVGLDASGNVRGSVVNAMIADLRAHGRRGLNFVVIGRPGDEVGIFTRVGEDWYPWVWFVTPRSYTDRLGFYERAESEVASQFPAILADEIDKELRRAAGQ